MRLSSKILLAVGLTATVVAVGFWLARIFVQTPVTTAESAPELDTHSGPVNTRSTLEKTTMPRNVAAVEPVSPATPLAAQSPIEAVSGGTNLITDWENRVDEVLRLDVAPAEAGKKLLEMLPQLPEDGRLEALQHAANLLSDEDYAPMGKMFIDPKTPADELEILMADVLNRPNSIKLPLLLQVARSTEHLNAGEAREILEVFLGESYDNDWDKWQAKVNEYLTENPDVSVTGNP